MTLSERQEQELRAWRNRMERSTVTIENFGGLPVQVERDMAGYPVFRVSGNVTTHSMIKFGGTWQPRDSHLPPGSRASWRRGTWA